MLWSLHLLFDALVILWVHLAGGNEAGALLEILWVLICWW